MFFEDTVAYRILSTNEWIVTHRDDVKILLEEQGLTSDLIELKPIAEAPPELFADALGDQLESNNYHDLVGIPARFLDALSDSGRTVTEKQELLLILARSLPGLI